MSTQSNKQRAAHTSWEVRERFEGFTLLLLHLHTGRTHQIRVHCAAVQHAVVGDPVYGPRKLLKNTKNKIPRVPDAMVAYLKFVKRQMLHAARLGFTHPATGEKMTFDAPMPADMQELLTKLREH
jgi:23S rRNA pseudouridine1911/1915/1917 synthase